MGGCWQGETRRGAGGRNAQTGRCRPVFESGSNTRQASWRLGWIAHRQAAYHKLSMVLSVDRPWAIKGAAPPAPHTPTAPCPGVRSMFLRRGRAEWDAVQPPSTAMAHGRDCREDERAYTNALAAVASTGHADTVQRGPRGASQRPPPLDRPPPQSIHGLSIASLTQSILDSCTPTYLQRPYSSRLVGA